jgi:hypothetical protein
MSAPPKSGKPVRGALLLVFVFLGGFLQVLRYASEHGMPHYPGLLVALVLFGIGPLKLLLHELGHVAANRLAGLRTLGFSWGPLCWKRLADGWHFRWMPQLGYLRGFVWLAPVSGDNLRRRLMLSFAGGVLAEVLSGCFALILFLAAPALGLSQFGLALGFWAVATLCAPLYDLPFDRPALRALFSGGKASDDFCNSFLPLISWATEVRPADWPEDLRPSPLESYYKYLDRGELESAIGELTLAIQEQVWGLKNRQICLEAAYYCARHENAPSKARAWLAPIKTGFPVERFVELRAEAAVLYADGNRLESAECAKEGLRLIESCQLTGWTLMNAALLRDLYKRGHAAQEGPEVAENSPSLSN